MVDGRNASDVTLNANLYGAGKSVRGLVTLRIKHSAALTKGEGSMKICSPYDWYNHLRTRAVAEGGSIANSGGRAPEVGAC